VLHLLQHLLAGADEDQVRMMEERVIVTDYYDNAIGHGSKKESESLLGDGTPRGAGETARNAHRDGCPAASAGEAGQ
jgi:hypothetical protein